MFKVLLISFIFLLPLLSKAQAKVDVLIEKRKCTYVNSFNGAKLFIHLNQDTSSYQSGLNYWLRDFINLPDSIKLLIVEKLLEYDNDTSLCCIDATGNSFNGIEACRGVPKSKRHNIQIDALYMVNRLCWPNTIDFYSCYPVLHDTKLKRDINSDPRKIKLVFASYKKWFAECKAKGKISAYFPFNNGRYVWFGGRKSLASNE